MCPPQNAALTAISPIDGRYAHITHSLRPIFSEFGLIRQRIRVEIEWLLALAESESIVDIPTLGDESIAMLRGIIHDFDETQAVQVKSIEADTRHDVKAVEYYLKQRITDQAPQLRLHCEFLHFACTSEDINNLGYALMLRQGRDQVLLPMIDRLIQSLRTLAHTHAAAPMLSRTHGQPASPTTLGKEIAVFVVRLLRQRDGIAGIPIRGKINGAVGNYNAHLSAYPAVDWHQFSQAFVCSLGLDWNPCTTQIEPRDGIAELLDAITRFNNVLLDCCRDIWTYISLGYFRQRIETNEIGSSTMPHKVNPIEFENAEGNLGIANALLSHLSTKLPVSRLQRDLSDSTAMRTLGTAIAHTVIALDSCAKGLIKLEVDQTRMNADLDTAWEVLAEPIQTVMRRYGLPQPYEQLKALTRGQSMDRETLREFISGLPLPDDVRCALLELTPATYTGDAERLAREV